MSRKCEILTTGPMSGNNRSHSNRATKRVFNVNLQSHKFNSDLLSTTIRTKISTRAYRTIIKYGGFDNFLLNFTTTKLSEKFQILKKMAKAKKKLLLTPITEATVEKKI
jgi:large subunit ribosomal protein L28